MPKTSTTSKSSQKSNLVGLTQSFWNKNGTEVKLKDFLTEKDWWELKSRGSILQILTHDAMKKIADEAGIRSDPEYIVLTQPSVSNNYTYLIQIKITDIHGKTTIELGESNRGNLGIRGRSNPANMAQKRAYDRAVRTHLKIEGLLGEDELPDEDEDQEMDKLSHEERKALTPLINEIFAVKKKSDLTSFKAKMGKLKVEYNENQLEVLRGLWKKKSAELTNSF